MNARSLLASLTATPRLTSVFGIDLRTLALFRVALAAVLLVDLLRHFGDLSALYTDFGVMPRAWMMQYDTPWRLSLYFINGTAGVTGTLLAVQCLAATALLFGWRTRGAAIVSFLMWGWLCNRNPMVLIGGDILMVCLLFWACFLPIAARWSFDAALSSLPPPRRNAHLSWASAGLMLQVLSTYFYSAFLKSGVEWRPDYTAVYYALSLDRYATPLGTWLLQFPSLLEVLTFYVWWLELLGPPLILAAPLLGLRLGQGLRFLLLMAFASLHVGFFLCLELGHFPFVSLASLTVYLGGWFWDWRAQQPQAQRAITIYYDQDCGFCLRTSLLIRTLLGLQAATVLPAQPHPRAKALLEAHWSWVVIDHEDRAHLKWSAFVALLRVSPLFAWLYRPLSANLLKPVGDAAYDVVGRNRGGVAKLSSGLLAVRAVRFDLGASWQKLAAAALLLIGLWNLSTIHAVPASVQRLLSPGFQLLRIDQLWNMFAPYPLKDDGWIVVEGTLANGKIINVLKPAIPVSFDKPYQLSQTHENLRWHTYLGRLTENEFAPHRLWFGKYLCRSWNADKLVENRDQRLLRFKLHFIVERTPPPGQVAQTERQVLWQHECFQTREPAADPKASEIRTGNPPEAAP